MKILFVGLGSIGQRHLQNINGIQKGINNNIQLFALRRSKNNKIIKDCKCFEVDSLPDYYNIKTTTSLKEAKKINPDITFVTNPSSLHIKTALEFAEIGSHLFIEKPLGNNLKNLDRLQEVIKKKKLISMIGYQTRFNPLIKIVKDIIEKNKEKIIIANFEWNTYLPSHHKYEDYSEGYAARNDLGGGVVLCLIHEIDLIYSLFGLPEKVFAVGVKNSDLKMDAEDTVMSILKYKNNEKFIYIYLNLSFAQTKEVRKFKVQFTDSTLFVDLIENKYSLYDCNGILIKEHKEDIKRNDLFINEISYFLDCVKKQKNTFIDIAEGRKSLEIALKIKESMKDEKWVK